MKVLITSLNPKHGVNPVVQRLFDPLIGWQRANASTCDVVMLSFIAEPKDFELDVQTMQTLVARRVPVIIFDHCEAMPPGYLLGCGPQPDNGYSELHRHVAQMNVRAYFKRELLTVFQSPLKCALWPIDWTVPNYGLDGTTDEPNQFMDRPIDILMSWGYSSESRPRLHGELLRKAGMFGAHFVMCEEDLEMALKEGRQRIFALLFCPWYRRIQLSKIIRWQKLAKVSISVRGMGLKCFRSAEAPYNSVMAHQTPEAVQWAFPWVAGENCIGLPNGDDLQVDEQKAVRHLYEWLRLRQGELHNLYLKGIANQRNYQSQAYSTQYLLPRISKALAQ